MMGDDCPESTLVRQRSFVGASNRSGNGPVLVRAIPASDRKNVAVLRVWARTVWVQSARNNTQFVMENMLCCVEEDGYPSRSIVQHMMQVRGVGGSCRVGVDEMTYAPEEMFQTANKGL